jgi:hypothetical protein
MGLASPGAFACASLAAARGAAEQQHASYAQRAASGASPDRVERRIAASPAGREAASAPPARERAAAWRAPSGPAPSQAPPAARS